MQVMTWLMLSAGVQGSLFFHRRDCVPSCLRSSFSMAVIRRFNPPCPVVV